MEISESILHDEVKHVFDSGQTTTNYSWSLVFHFNDTDKPYEPLKILGLTIERNYIFSFTDEVVCRVLVPLGKYAKKIYPNRKNLKVTLTKKILAETNLTDQVEEIQNKPDGVDMYTAILLNSNKSPTEAQGREASEEDTLDLIDLVEVDLQLINTSIEQIRTIQVGGVFTNVKVDDLLTSLLTSETKKVETDNSSVLLGIDLLPVTNTESKQQIVIPHGTGLTDVPGYLQKRIGVYSSGLGSYIQDKYWYLYYLYDTSKYQERLDTLTLIVLPQNKYPQVERTFIKTNGAITLLVTGDTSFTDDNGTMYVNGGNGARFSNANLLMDSNSKTSDNKTIVSRGKLNTEVVSDKKKDNPNYSPITNTKITANPLAVYSEMASRNGALFQMVWHNCDHQLLRPGIMTRLLFEDEGEVKEYNGILHNATYTSRPVDGIMGNIYNHQAILKFFIRKKKD